MIYYSIIILILFYYVVLCDGSMMDYSIRTFAQDTGQTVFTSIKVNGNYIYGVGRTDTNFDNHTHIGGKDIIIGKYLKDGTKIWTKQYGTVGDDLAVSIDIDSNSNIFICGTTNGQWDKPPLLDDVFISRLDSSGNELFTKMYQSFANDACTSIVVTSLFLYTTGFTQDSFEGQILSGTQDLFILKTDFNGTIIDVLQSGTFDGNIKPFSISADSSNNIIVSGHTDASIFGQPYTGNGNDGFVVKFASNLQVLWAEMYGSIQNETGQQVTIDANDAVIICGVSGGSMNSENNPCLNPNLCPYVFKYSTSGTFEWLRIGGSNSFAAADHAHCNVDNYDNIYVTTYDFSTANSWLVKYSSTGTYQWSEYYGDSNGLVEPYAIDLDNNNNMFIGGSLNVVPNIYPTLALPKRLMRPPSYFAHMLSTPTDDDTSAIVSDLSGNIYVVGTTGFDIDGQTAFGGGGDMLIVKYTDKGVKQFTKLLGGIGFDAGKGVAVSALYNTIYVVGQAGDNVDGETFQGGSSDALLARYDLNGNKLFVNLIGGSGNEVAVDVAIDSFGNAIVLGDMDAAFMGLPYQGLGDIWIAAYNQTGDNLWISSISTPASDIPTGISVDSSDNIYICGQTAGDLNGVSKVGNTDGFITKYSSAMIHQWTKLIGSAPSGRIKWNDIAVSSSHLYVVGYADGPVDDHLHNAFDDIIVGKYTLNAGIKVWTKLMGSNQTDQGNGIAIDSKDNIYITGQSGSINGVISNSSQAIIIAYIDTFGTLLWTKLLETASTEASTGKGIFIDNFDRSFVAAYSKGKIGGQEPNNIGVKDSGYVLFSSSNDIKWTRLLTASNKNAITGLGVIDETKVSIAGWTQGYFDENILTSGNQDVYTAILDNDLGDTQQFQLQNHPSNTLVDQIFDVCTDKNSTFTVAIGKTLSHFNGITNKGGEDILILKYDSNNAIMYTELIGDTANDVGSVVVCSGNFFYGGAIIKSAFVDGVNNPSPGNSSIMIFKYNIFDNSRQYLNIDGSGGSETVTGITIDDNENIYLTGITTGTFGAASFGSIDMFVVKYDSFGNRVWVQQLGSTESDYGNDITINSLSEIYVVGTTAGNFDGLISTTGIGINSVVLVKFDTNGNKQWSIILDSTSNTAIETRCIVSFGISQVLIGGKTGPGGLEHEVSNGGGEDAFIASYNTNATLQWVKLLSTNNADDIIAHLSVDISSSSLYANGHTTGNFDGKLNRYFVRSGFVVKLDLSATSTTSNLLKECPSNVGFINDGYCIFVDTNEVKSNYDSVRKKCHDKEAQVAHISNSVQYTQLNSIVTSFVNEDVWIGLSSDATLSEWRWENGEIAYASNLTEYLFTGWKAANPSTDSTRQCTRTRRDGSGWQNRNCMDVYRGTCSRPYCSENVIDGYCYFTTSTAASFDDARNECLQYSGGDLAIIETLDDLNSILLQISENVYIGIKKKEVDSIFQNTHGLPIKFASWDVSEPNVNAGNCVQLMITGLWKVVNCTIVIKGLCRRPVCTGVISGGVCFWPSSSLGSLTNVQLECKSYSYGDIAKISSSNQNIGIHNSINNQLANKFWIGLNDIQAETYWRWLNDLTLAYISGGTQYLYTNWGIPPTTSVVKNCASISESDGSWSEENCNEQFKGICRRPYCPGIIVGNRCYWLTYFAGPWNEVDDICREQENGQLATIETELENEAVVKVANGNDVWFGAFQYFDFTVFWRESETNTTISDGYWGNNLVHFGWTNWKYTFPTNSGCGLLKSSDNGTWSTGLCTNSKKGVCSKTITEYPEIKNDVQMLPIEDTTIISLDSNSYGSTNLLSIDNVNVGGGSELKIPLIKFDMSNIPSYRDIVLAQVLFYFDNIYSGAEFISCHRVLVNWSESTNGTEWASTYDASEILGDEIELVPLDTNSYSVGDTQSGALLKFDITATVRKWYKGSIENFGVALIMNQPTGNTLKIHSNEAFNLKKKPRLYVVSVTKPVTEAPTLAPSETPTISPSNTPSNVPTMSPSKAPSNTPTFSPVTLAPSNSPSNVPTMLPSKAPSNTPTFSPVTPTPSISPSNVPSMTPSKAPSNTPTFSPVTLAPSISPSNVPTMAPSKAPSNTPSSTPTQQPSDSPSETPSNSPTNSPTSFTLYCSYGQYVHQNIICKQCAPGTFMNESIHSYLNCFSCPQDYYQDRSGQQTCWPCQSFTFTGSNGQSSCNIKFPSLRSGLEATFMSSYLGSSRPEIIYFDIIHPIACVSLLQVNFSAATDSHWKIIGNNVDWTVSQCLPAGRYWFLYTFDATPAASPNSYNGQIVFTFGSFTVNYDIRIEIDSLTNEESYVVSAISGGGNFIFEKYMDVTNTKSSSIAKFELSPNTEPTGGILILKLIEIIFARKSGTIDSNIHKLTIGGNDISSYEQPLEFLIDMETLDLFCDGNNKFEKANIVVDSREPLIGATTYSVVSTLTYEFVCTPECYSFGGCISPTISAGPGFTCVLKSSTVYCYGSYFEENTVNITGNSFNRIEVGVDYVAAIDTLDRVVYTIFPINAEILVSSDSMTYVDLKSIPNVRSQSGVDSSHLCAVTSSNIYCSFGLAEAVSDPSWASNLEYYDIAASHGFVCINGWDISNALNKVSIKAVTSIQLGTIRCWVNPQHQQPNDFIPMPAIVTASERWAMLQAGVEHVCAWHKISKLVECWFGDTYKQSSSVSSTTQYQALAVGGYHTCLLEMNGQVVCYGLCSQGQTNVPKQLKNMKIIGITAGLTHSCAQNIKGELICWGEENVIKSVPQNLIADHTLCQQAGSYALRPIVRRQSISTLTITIPDSTSVFKCFDIITSLQVINNLKPNTRYSCQLEAKNAGLDIVVKPWQWNSITASGNMITNSVQAIDLSPYTASKMFTFDLDVGASTGALTLQAINNAGTLTTVLQVVSDNIDPDSLLINCTQYHEEVTNNINCQLLVYRLGQLFTIPRGTITLSDGLALDQEASSIFDFSFTKSTPGQYLVIASYKNTFSTQVTVYFTSTPNDFSCNCNPTSLTGNSQSQCICEGLINSVPIYINLASASITTQVLPITAGSIGPIVALSPVIAGTSVSNTFQFVFTSSNLSINVSEVDANIYLNGQNVELLTIRSDSSVVLTHIIGVNTQVYLYYKKELTQFGPDIRSINQYNVLAKSLFVVLGTPSNLGPSNILISQPTITQYTTTTLTVQLHSKLPGKIWLIVTDISIYNNPALDQREFVNDIVRDKIVGAICKRLGYSISNDTVQTIVIGSINACNGQPNTPYHLHIVVNSASGSYMSYTPLPVNWENIKTLQHLNVIEPSNTILQPNFTTNQYNYAIEVHRGTVSNVKLNIQLTDPKAVFQINGNNIVHNGASFDVTSCLVKDVSTICKFYVISQIGLQQEYKVAITPIYPPKQSTSSSVSIKYDGSYPSDENELLELENNLKQSLAIIFGVPESKVVNLVIKSGSIIVDFDLLDSNSTALNDTLNNLIGTTNGVLTNITTTSTAPKTLKQCKNGQWIANNVNCSSIVECPSSTCNNNSESCYIINGFPQCTCKHGWNGTLCETRIWFIYNGSMSEYIGSALTCNNPFSLPNSNYTILNRDNSWSGFIRIAASLTNAKTYSVFFGPPSTSKLPYVRFACPLIEESKSSTTSDPDQPNQITVCCQLPNTYGRKLVMYIHVNVNNQTIILEGNDTIIHPNPTITPNTLHVVGKSFNTPILTDTILGDVIQFSGTNFVVLTNVLNSGIQIYFSSSLDTPKQYTCTIVSMNLVNVTCSLPPGEFVNVRFTLDILGASSNTGVDLLSTPTPPAIYSIFGCNQQDGNATKNCPTSGGIRITINGRNLKDPLFLTVDGTSCWPMFFTGINGSQIECILGEGTGFNVPVVAVYNEINSAPLDPPLLSYAAPNISLLQASECNMSSPTHIDNCTRIGGYKLTIMGNNFGKSEADILVGLSKCLNVQHDTIIPHAKITCTMPNGTTENQGVIVLQNYGEISTSSALVSFHQCSPGESEDGLVCKSCIAGYVSPSKASTNCTECEPGYFSSASRLSSCSRCQVGYAQDKPAASHCDICKPGFFANSKGEFVCRPCDAGSFNDIQGSSNCTQCTIGTAQSESGQSSCFDCLLENGVFQPSVGASACDHCKPGDFARYVNDQLIECARCPVGAICNGSSVVSKTNFWLLRDPSTGLYTSHQCLPGQCIGNNRCQIGRLQDSNNRVCAECESGKHEWGGTCVECDGVRWDLLFVMLLLGTGFVVGFHKISQVTSTGSLKIFMYYVQNAFLFVGENVVIAWLEVFNFQPTSSTGASVCLWNISQTARMGLGMAFPICAPLILFIIMSFHYIYCVKFGEGVRDQKEVDQEQLEQNENNNVNDMGDQEDTNTKKRAHYVPTERLFPPLFDIAPYYRTALGLYVFSYNAVIISIFNFLKCSELPDGRKYVEEFPAVDCGDSSYNTWLIVALIVLIFASSIIPGIIYLQLRKGQVENKLTSLVFVRKFGVLFDTYSDDAIFWELIVLLRRTILVALVVFLSQDRVLMFCLCTIFNMLIFASHIWLKPFLKKIDNLLESFSLYILTLLTVLLPVAGTPPFTIVENALYGALVLIGGFVIVGVAVYVELSQKAKKFLKKRKERKRASIRTSAVIKPKVTSSTHQFQDIEMAQMNDDGPIRQESLSMRLPSIHDNEGNFNDNQMVTRNNVNPKFTRALTKHKQWSSSNLDLSSDDDSSSSSTSSSNSDSDSDTSINSSFISNYSSSSISHNKKTNKKRKPRIPIKIPNAVREGPSMSETSMPFMSIESIVADERLKEKNQSIRAKARKKGQAITPRHVTSTGKMLSQLKLDDVPTSITAIKSAYESQNYNTVFNNPRGGRSAQKTSNRKLDESNLDIKRPVRMTGRAASKHYVNTQQQMSMLKNIDSETMLSNSKISIDNPLHDDPPPKYGIRMVSHVDLSTHDKKKIGKYFDGKIIPKLDRQTRQ